MPYFVPRRLRNWCHSQTNPALDQAAVGVTAGDCRPLQGLDEGNCALAFRNALSVAMKR